MKLLFIRLRLIGDVVFTTPAVAAVRAWFPEAHLSYLVEAPAAAVVSGNRHLDDVIVAGRRRGLGRLEEDLRLVRRLRRERYDVVVDFHGGPRAAWLAFLSRAPVRVGYRIPGREWMYTHPVDRARGLRPRHSVENQWDLLAALAPDRATPPDPSRNAVEMTTDHEAMRRVAGRLVEAGVGAGHELIVVHVSAGNPFRRWPTEAFVGLLVLLSSGARNRRIILSSGPSEREAARRIGAAAAARLGPGGRDSLVDFGDTTIAELHALIGRAALFIGGDTGPLHVAATTRTPIVGLYGPTLAARSRPWRDPSLVSIDVEPGALACRPCEQRRCAPGDFRCLTGLSPERVSAAAESALNEARGARPCRSEPI